jgi:hypothetical protein
MTIQKLDCHCILKISIDFEKPLLHSFFNNIGVHKIQKTNDHSKTGQSGIQIVIFRTQFVSRNRMLPPLENPTSYRMVKLD